VPFDVPSAEPAPTRRSRRVADARPVTQAPLTRRQLRALGADAAHRAPETLSDLPAVPAPAAPVRHIRLEADVPAEPAAAEKAEPEAIAETVTRAEVPAAEAQAAEAQAAEAQAAEAQAAEAPAAEKPLPEDPVDLFIEAARALNFTGETPVASPEPDLAAESEPRTGAHHVARRPSAFRRVATVAASISAFGVVGLLAVGMTTPITALAADVDVAAATTSISASGAEEAAEEEIQAFVAPAEVKNAQIERASGYETATFAELAAVTGINTANAVYVNDPTADIQWPIVLGTSMSSAFGQRWGRLHEGIDFTPGNGAPIQAIADGTVRVATEAGGAYGVHVYIDHVIDGQVISSHYAHMQYGSLNVVPGQQVEVGDVLGVVGNTGRSFGAHLHFELRLPGGQAIDPMPWLKEHAGTHYPKGQVEETVGEAADAAENAVEGVAGE
jgi:murein DD-endopeptidase MepM/ murein hydrolase activator NlpD